VDCVLLIGVDFPLNASAASELRAGLPYISMSIVEQKAFEDMVERFFATDRDDIPKGMIEVVS
jgi:hypothetical protein